MTAWLGKCFLFAGCLLLGLLRGNRLNQRRDCLDSFRRSLAGLSRELAFSLRPVDVLLEEAAAGEPGPAAAFYRACRWTFRQQGRESWAESWAAALAAVPLPLLPPDLLLLREVGQVLGRYDGACQQQALAGLLDRLTRQRDEAGETARRLFRVDVTLGVTAGLFCLILL